MPKDQTFNLFTGAILLVLGWLFYQLTRDGYWFSVLTPVDVSWIPTVLLGSLPSLLHVVALSIITAALALPRRLWLLAPWFWVAVNVVFEVGQWSGSFYHEWLGYFERGTFDVWDLAFAIFGGVISLAILSDQEGRQHWKPLWSRVGQGFALLVGLSTIVGSGHGYMGPVKGGGSPVYMSYEQLRDSVVFEAPRDLGHRGKIYLYKQFLLISQPNQGIHVVDNEDPENPQNIGFIVIPGNVDMAVKDDILFADSFIDLVMVDIRDMENVQEVNRRQNVFPYNPRQALGENQWILEEVDRSKGVVIGVEEYQ